jgi:hypothetical protein
MPIVKTLQRVMHKLRVIGACLAVAAVSTAAAQDSTPRRILFIGNSFTFAQGSAVRYFHPESVTDLNGSAMGGMPALFKAFTQQAGLAYDVTLETQPGSGLEFHIENRRDRIARPWDLVVMHGQSTLDFAQPGDPAKLVRTSREMAELLMTSNADARFYLLSTWARADQTYPAAGAWAGKPIEAMANDVRNAYDQAAANTPNLDAVIPVGEAWTRAMQQGIADPNPYDGIAFEQLDLWTYDHYHASAHGSYLEALVVFGTVTKRDPRSLGACAGFELGFSTQQVIALQQVAAAQLLDDGLIQPGNESAESDPQPQRCR